MSIAYWFLTLAQLHPLAPNTTAFLSGYLTSSTQVWLLKVWKNYLKMGKLCYKNRTWKHPEHETIIQVTAKQWQTTSESNILPCKQQNSNSAVVSKLMTDQPKPQHVNTWAKPVSIICTETIRHSRHHQKTFPAITNTNLVSQYETNFSSKHDRKRLKSLIQPATNFLLSSRVPPYPLYMFVRLRLVCTKGERFFRLFQNGLSNHFQREISVQLCCFILSSDTENFEREKAGRMKPSLFQEKGRLPLSPPPPPCFLYASTSDITLFLPLPLEAKVPTPCPVINTNFRVSAIGHHITLRNSFI